MITRSPPHGRAQSRQKSSQPRETPTPAKGGFDDWEVQEVKPLHSYPPPSGRPVPVTPTPSGSEQTSVLSGHANGFEPVPDSELDAGFSTPVPFSRSTADVELDENGFPPLASMAVKPTPDPHATPKPITSSQPRPQPLPPSESPSKPRSSFLGTILGAFSSTASSSAEPLPQPNPPSSASQRPSTSTSKPPATRLLSSSLNHSRSLVTPTATLLGAQQRRPEEAQTEYWKKQWEKQAKLTEDIEAKLKHAQERNQRETESLKRKFQEKDEDYEALVIKISEITTISNARSVAFNSSTVAAMEWEFHQATRNFKQALSQRDAKILQFQGNEHWMELQIEDLKNEVDANHREATIIAESHFEEQATLQANLASATEAVEELQKANAELEQLKATNKAELKRLQKQLREVEATSTSLSSELEAAQSELSSLRSSSKSSASALQAELTKLKKGEEREAQEVESLRTAKVDLELRLKTVEENLKAEKKKAKERERELSAEKAELARAAAEEKDEVERALKEENEGLREQIATAKERIRELRREVQTATTSARMSHPPPRSPTPPQPKSKAKPKPKGPSSGPASSKTTAKGKSKTPLFRADDDDDDDEEDEDPRRGATPSVSSDAEVEESIMRSPPPRRPSTPPRKTKGKSVAQSDDDADTQASPPPKKAAAKAKTTGKSTTSTTANKVAGKKSTPAPVEVTEVVDSDGEEAEPVRPVKASKASKASSTTSSEPKSRPRPTPRYNPQALDEEEDEAPSRSQPSARALGKRRAADEGPGLTSSSIGLGRPASQGAGPGKGKRKASVVNVDGDDDDSASIVAPQKPKKRKLGGALGLGNKDISWGNPSMDDNLFEGMPVMSPITTQKVPPRSFSGQVRR
ncbi:hypothetical protein DL93DRAFT_2078079 [Clavulina sp. PMI_390]|nr:hypothetical protein DL93DRAFT_2078079 [Clavulina sp. PMI_390]